MHIVKDHPLIEAMIKDGRAQVVSNPNPIAPLRRQMVKKTYALAKLRWISADIDATNAAMRRVATQDIIELGEQQAYAKFMGLRHKLASLEYEAQGHFFNINGTRSIFSNQESSS